MISSCIRKTLAWRDTTFASSTTAIAASMTGLTSLDLVSNKIGDAGVKALLDACAGRGIALEAYSPLGTGTHLSEPVVKAIADSLERTPAQILLRWCVQRGIPLVTKSTHRDRIAENTQIFDFELEQTDMERLDALDRSGGTRAAMEHKWW